MRQAIFDAQLGDDVLGDDPTVKALEAKAAARLEKEAALFVASGTMANLVSLLVHCGRGDEAVVGSMSHILQIEQAGAAALGSIQLRSVKNDETGHLDLAELKASIRPPGLYQPRTAMVALENTHNAMNGSALPSSIGTSSESISIMQLSTWLPRSAESRCSTGTSALAGSARKRSRVA